MNPIDLELQKPSEFTGLTESTPEDEAMFDECMAQAVPLTTLFRNNNDAAKYLQWDSELEKYMRYHAELLDHEGREKMLPWNLYTALGLKWVGGLYYSQQGLDCASFGHRNSFNYSNLVKAYFTKKVPVDVAQSVTYAIARGNGTPRYGAGLNLNPMSKWAAEVGNHWTADFGPYDNGGYVRKYTRDSQAAKNALKTQSVIGYLPQPSFDNCYKACAAGFGVHIGSASYPAASKLNSDGLSQVSRWASGGHAMALVASWVAKSGKLFVYLANSHGAKYTADSLNPKPQWGCWLDASDVKTMATSNYGRWHINAGELLL